MHTKRMFLFVLLLGIIAGWFFSPILQAEEKSAVKVGYGWSTKGGGTVVRSAVSEAVSMLKKNVKNPDVLFLFSTVGYNSEVLLSELHEQLGEKVKIYGGTSCLGVMTPEGFHVGKNASLAILGVNSDRIQFGVGGADLDEEESPRIAGKRAITAAIRDAGRKVEEKPNIIFITAAPGKEEKILEGIADIVGADVPVLGGSSGDNDITGRWKQFVNDKVYSNGIALNAVYTDLKIGWSYEGGYLRTAQQGVITKAKGRTIYEIDGKPAALVYNDWLGGIFDDLIETGGNVLTRTTFHPLAKVIRGRKGEIYHLSIHPLSIDLPEKSLTVFADVKTGDTISLLYGNWELLLNRAHSTPMKALIHSSILKEESLFAIYTFCAGTMLAIPRDEMPKMPLLIKDVVGPIPFIGIFTFGEQGFLPGIGNSHGNLVSSIVIFAK